MKTNPLEDRRKTLEESFFKKRNARLVEALREKARRAEEREDLSEVSGVTDTRTLNLLLDLDIDSETLAALTLTPLVEIAWADGTLETNERKAILATAESVGITPESESYLLLENWLERVPPARLLKAWEAYVTALGETLAPEAREALKEDVLGRVRQVASAAGGFLGLGRRISAAEQEVLDRVERAFE